MGFFKGALLRLQPSAASIAQPALPSREADMPTYGRATTRGRLSSRAEFEQRALNAQLLPAHYQPLYLISGAAFSSSLVALALGAKSCRSPEARVPIAASAMTRRELTISVCCTNSRHPCGPGPWPLRSAPGSCP